MGAWRVFLREHRWLALWLIAAALAVKALVPQGYMLADTGGKTLTVAICDGSGPATMAITLPMDPDHAKAPDSAKQDGGCAYSSLSHAITSGTDPVLLLAAIAFLLALGFAPAPQPMIRRRAFAQPPAQGPPALA
ncbi:MULTISPECIES: DUF2946 family protein [unclassified Sphingomonas]|jgi:hypothetical protein|uniref:DUF2946 family protein n=2 Tax=Pseudomonadota TaxID=1224 RepID=UPI000ACBB2FF|nr:MULTISPECIES: DUF2946 family protein [unclassified Sphingomonas]